MGRKSRPSTSAIFIVSTQPGDTTHEVGEDRSRRRAVYRNEAVPGVAAEQRPAASARARRPARRADGRPPDPRRPAARARCATVSRVRRRSAEKPIGWCASRSKVAANSPATKSTTKQNATCSDHRVHQAAPRVRVRAAVERARRTSPSTRAAPERGRTATSPPTSARCRIPARANRPADRGAPDCRAD